MAGKVAIDNMRVCAMEEQDVPVRSAVSLAIRSVAGNILDEGVVACHMQRARMRAVVCTSTIKAFSVALLKNDNLMAPVATFLSKYVDEELNCAKKEESSARSRSQTRNIRFCFQPQSRQTMMAFRPKRKKFDAYVLKRRTGKSQVCLRRVTKFYTAVHAWRASTLL